MIKFYLRDHDGNRKEMTDEEVRYHMSDYNILEAVQAKLEDPNEEVSFMTVGGFIVVELI